MVSYHQFQKTQPTVSHHTVVSVIKLPLSLLSLMGQLQSYQLNTNVLEFVCSFLQRKLLRMQAKNLL